MKRGIGSEDTEAPELTVPVAKVCFIASATSLARRSRRSGSSATMSRAVAAATAISGEGAVA